MYLQENQLDRIWPVDRRVSWFTTCLRFLIREAIRRSMRLIIGIEPPVEGIVIEAVTSAVALVVGQRLPLKRVSISCALRALLAAFYSGPQISDQAIS